MQVILRTADKQDTFYFGNAIGETGNSPADALVDGTDFVGARDNPHTVANRADIDDRFDFDRDSLVNVTDVDAVRDNATNIATALRLITVPRQSSASSGQLLARVLAPYTVLAVSGANFDALADAHGPENPASAAADFLPSQRKMAHDAVFADSAYLEGDTSFKRSKQSTVRSARVACAHTGVTQSDRLGPGATAFELKKETVVREMSSGLCRGRHLPKF